MADLDLVDLYAHGIMLDEYYVGGTLHVFWKVKKLFNVMPVSTALSSCKA